MATWEAVLDLLPKGSDPQELDVTFDARHAVQTLDHALPRVSAWSPRLIRWGEDDSHRIEAIEVSDGNVQDLKVRFDLRRPFDSFLSLVCGVARNESLVFRTPAKSLLSPSLRTLRRYLKSTDAYRFVASPPRFLDDLEKCETDSKTRRRVGVSRQASVVAHRRSIAE